jgi:hypothetical protein
MHSTLEIESVDASEKTVMSYQTTLCHIPEDNPLLSKNITILQSLAHRGFHILVVFN